MKNSTTYCLRLLALFMAGLLLLAGWNALIDPFDLYHARNWQGFNHFNALTGGNNERMVKPQQMARIRPDALILGTSRADWAIDPGHAFFSDAERPFNAALGGGTMYEAKRLLEHACAVGEVKRVVVGLDIEMFNLTILRDETMEGRLAVSPTGKRQWLSRWVDFGPTLVSQDAWDASRATIKKSKRHKHLSRNELMQRGGAYQEGLIKPQNRWKAFDQRWREAHANMAPLKHPVMVERIEKNMVAYRELLTLAYEQDIDLHFYISPYHVSVLEIIRQSKNWDAFEAWKRQLLTLNEEAAKAAGHEAFPLWDFSSYHSIALDESPNSIDTDFQMAWWAECSHFRKVVGDQMLDHLSGQVAAEDVFAYRLNTDNLEERLADQRALQKAFLEQSP